MVIGLISLLCLFFKYFRISFLLFFLALIFLINILRDSIASFNKSVTFSSSSSTSNKFPSSINSQVSQKYQNLRPELSMAIGMVLCLSSENVYK